MSRAGVRTEHWIRTGHQPSDSPGITAGKRCRKGRRDPDAGTLPVWLRLSSTLSFPGRILQHWRIHGMTPVSWTPKPLEFSCFYDMSTNQRAPTVEAIQTQRQAIPPTLRCPLEAGDRAHARLSDRADLSEERGSCQAALRRRIPPLTPVGFRRSRTRLRRASPLLGKKRGPQLTKPPRFVSINR